MGNFSFNPLGNGWTISSVGLSLRSTRSRTDSVGVINLRHQTLALPGSYVYPIEYRTGVYEEPGRPLRRPQGSSVDPSQITPCVVSLPTTLHSPPLTRIPQPTEYFYPNTFAFALDLDVWSNFESSTGLVPLGTARNLNEGEYVDPPGLNNLGPLKRAEYDRKLAESKVLVGIGRPEISPSPYAAL
jgi:hypothetical protein